MTRFFFIIIINILFYPQSAFYPRSAVCSLSFTLTDIHLHFTNKRAYKIRTVLNAYKYVKDFKLFLTQKRT